MSRKFELRTASEVEAEHAYRLVNTFLDGRCWRDDSTRSIRIDGLNSDCLQFVVDPALVPQPVPAEKQADLVASNNTLLERAGAAEAESAELRKALIDALRLIGSVAATLDSAEKAA